jgi:S-methylmethionine-dependent homocysteine/selenocysteine methylase
MSKYRNRLPQLGDRLFLTDGGLETTLIFHDKIELPHFAAFDLLRTQNGKTALRKYYERYLDIAKTHRTGFILESPTWRASLDWGEKLGYSAEALAVVNREAIDLMTELRAQYQSPAMPVAISACLGPRGDGYDPGQVMTADEAQAYHSFQVRIFSETEADMVTGITITNTNEAIGIARAAHAFAMPCAISFTLETDGCLPTGQSLREAIETVDRATGGGPAYYMINCAHPTHFETTLGGGDWIARIRGLRANASTRSHTELNESPDLDDGNPAELGRQYRDLLGRHGHINVLGGCCGTDHRHVEEISLACKMAA